MVRRMQQNVRVFPLNMLVALSPITVMWRLSHDFSSANAATASFVSMRPLLSCREPQQHLSGCTRPLLRTIFASDAGRTHVIKRHQHAPL
jgi:hypothetical protein